MEDGFTTKSKDYFDSKLCIQKIGDWLVTDTLIESDKNFVKNENNSDITKRRVIERNVLDKEVNEHIGNTSRKIWRRCPDNNLRFELDMGVLMPTLKKKK